MKKIQINILVLYANYDIIMIEFWRDKYASYQSKCRFAQ